MRRARSLCRLYYTQDEATEDGGGRSVIDTGYAARIVYTGRYWWTRLCTPDNTPLGPWELTSEQDVQAMIT